MNRNLHILFIKKPVLTLIIILMSFGAAYSAKNENKLASIQVKIVKCYPNPATSVINFEFQKTADKNAVLQIYSFSGKKMADISASLGKVSIALDNEYYRGIYVFQLRDKNGKIIETGKFQVVK